MIFVDDRVSTALEHDSMTAGLGPGRGALPGSVLGLGALLAGGETGAEDGEVVGARRSWSREGRGLTVQVIPFASTMASGSTAVKSFIARLRIFFAWALSMLPLARRGAMCAEAENNDSSA